MPPKFGTSGLRGLVTDLTDACVQRYVHAFLKTCPVGSALFVGHDLRASSPALAATVAMATRQAGIDVRICGAVPTPVLALAAMQDNASAIMVTGSHIPADRNGLKFYTPQGEITKAQEALIEGALGLSVDDRSYGTEAVATQVQATYTARYQTAFHGALKGLRIGHYAHSAVGREALAALLQNLGATVVPLGWSDAFVPVDTEAVAENLRHDLRRWTRDNALDAIVSTDADGDRPLLADERGEVVPGDILGQITAAFLSADMVVTPISSNSGAERSGRFAHVIRTAIGSPHVIAAMQAGQGAVVGYEANGGFMMGFQAQGLAGPLPPLMTRDAVLPLLAVLAESAGRGVASTVAAQPARFTATGRIKNVDTHCAIQFLDDLVQSRLRRDRFLSPLNSPPRSLDHTDGLQITLEDARVVHMRLSGNAPEMRVYIEDGAKVSAEQTCATVLSCLAQAIQNAPMSHHL